jgi:hypothetical protein
MANFFERGTVTLGNALSCFQPMQQHDDENKTEDETNYCLCGC